MKKSWPIFLLLGIELILFLLNYIPGTYLVGWDNLYPELNFSTNFTRGFFSIWQEYRGLGLLDGMSHAANLPHTLFIFLLSFVLPQSLLRYFFIFLMHLLGGLGVYLLINQLLGEYRSKRIVSFIGGLFYLFNIATVQMFYAPLELFTVHFAFLPWLLLSVINYLKSGFRKDLIWFGILSFLSIPQAHVPTLFIIYIIALFIILGFHLFYTKGNGLKSIITIFFLTFTINTFWGLPYIYSAFHNSKTIADSKINQMSTEDIYLKNKAYGDLESIALMKGFSFDFVDLQGGVNDYMMAGWRKHVQDPLFIIIGLSFFGLAILGLIKIIIDKEKRFYPFVFLFILSFLMLGTDIPVLSIISGFFYNYVPYFFQVFRFTFTKFSILYALSFSILFAFGLSVLLDSLTKIKHLNRILIFALFFIFAYYSFPAWQGEFLYKNLKIKIPKEYFELVDYFEKQNKNTRIATLPQPSFWGWTYTKWGYRGSGFLWYGLPQATLDGAFYPWSKEDENYYHEISYALYSRNQKLFEDILEKYQIRWLLVDGNIISFASGKTLYLDHLEQLIATSDKFVLASQFGKIKIYKVNLETSPKDFVFLEEGLSVVGPEYKWGNYDKAYEEYGNYVTSSQLSVVGSKKETTKKSAFADSGEFSVSGTSASQASSRISRHDSFVKCVKSGPEGNCTPELLLERQSPHYARPTQNQVYQENNMVINKVFAEDNSDSSTPEVSLPLIYYPFRSLFTGRQQEELEFKVEDNRDYFSFQAKIPQELVEKDLVIPKIDEEEISEVDVNDLSKSSKKYPQIYLDGELIDTSSFWGAGVTPESDSGQARMTDGMVDLQYIKKGDLEIRIPKINGYYSSNLQPITHNPQPKNCDQFNQGIFTHERVKPLGTSRSDPDLLRLTSIGSSNCLDFDLSHLAQRLGYLVTVENRNMEGKSLLFSVINKNSQRADLETYLPKLKRVGPLSGSDPVLKSYFIIPPMELFGLGYTLHLDNISIGRVKTVNDLGRITVNPIPYRFLTSLKVISENVDYSSSDPPVGGESRSLPRVQPRGSRPASPAGRQAQTVLDSDKLTINHPNPSLYQVSISNEAMKQFSNDTTLVLSQSYDSGWHAYQSNNSLFPFLFGKELKDHVLVNNWENGWLLNNETMKQSNNGTIIIVYLPQYLEYIGFGLLGVGILIVIKYSPNQIVSQFN